MDELADRIREELNRWPYAQSVVTEDELMRIWPKETDRRQRLEEFAKKHHFHLRFYVKSFGAIFARQPSD